MDEIDIFLKRIEDVLATGNREELFKLNKEVDYKLEELVRSFSSDILEVQNFQST
ncbi:MAG: hypothetical protein ACYDG2_14630 [Ruminiclostridium sp.]